METRGERRGSAGRARRTVLILAAALAALAVAAWAAGEQLSVQVRTAKLRAKPSFLGAPVGELAYGATVTVQARQGPWVQVAGQGASGGWLHESALGRQQVAMQAGGAAAGTGASGGEVALAGKGFNEEVEKEYRQQNADLDFTWVDRMETFRVTAEQAAEFLRQGRLEQPQGGR